MFVYSLLTVLVALWYMSAALGPQRREVVCPDGERRCEDDQTCCESISSGYHYGCCPYPNGTCCNDEEHCCPEGYTCGVSECDKEDSKSHQTLPSLTNLPHPKSVLCPDNETQCRNSYTCCMLESHEWGCCPYPSAVCCSDGQHCCPMGYTCDLPYCSKGDEQISVMKHQQPVRRGFRRVGVLAPKRLLHCKN